MYTRDLTRNGLEQQRVRTLILVIGTIVVLAMVYGSGMRAQTRIARRIDEQRKVAEREYRVAQRDLLQRLAVARQLEARRQLALAVTELDARNFGTAQKHLGQAVEQLKLAGAVNATGPDFTSLAEQMAGSDLTVSSDVGSQRQMLLKIAEQMDKMLEPYLGEFFGVSSEYDKAHPIKSPTLNDVPQLPGPEIGR